MSVSRKSNIREWTNPVYIPSLNVVQEGMRCLYSASHQLDLKNTRNSHNYVYEINIL